MKESLVEHKDDTRTHCSPEPARQLPSPRFVSLNYLPVSCILNHEDLSLRLRNSILADLGQKQLELQCQLHVHGLWSVLGP